MSILKQICDDKLEHVAVRKGLVSVRDLEALIAGAEDVPRGFYAALRRRVDAGQTALIAEIKKASPSKGLIRADFEPVQLARDYASGGAACLSVLTDVPYFMGADDYLVAARAAVELPCLRKDFMLEPYQIMESRALGADCVLLIMAALSDGQAVELEAVAMGLGMDVLVEVHDEVELERALKWLESPLIGVNNRNLKTMVIDVATTGRLAKLVPEGKLLVCESGVFGRDVVEDVQAQGVFAFLVGESLMRQADVVRAVREIVG